MPLAIEMAFEKTIPHSHFCKNLGSGSGQVKGLFNLSLNDPQEFQEIAHVKSCSVDTSYLFDYETNSSQLIKCCLVKSWGGSQSKCMHRWNSLTPETILPSKWEIVSSTIKSSLLCQESYDHHLKLNFLHIFLLICT